jgi:peptidoglycan/xylan/chitin deacetylase (PgdA/CDA1 family)
VLTRAANVLSRVCGMRQAAAFGILMYHRVAEPTPGVPVPTWNVSPRQFEAQLAGLLRRGFEAWPLRRALEHHRAGKPISRRAFVVTFDDGYENNFLHAFPILKRLHVPATIFLATAYLDSDEPFPSDDWHAAGSDKVPAYDWRPLQTSQCRQMQNSGLIELAAHTHTHDDFRSRDEDFRADLAVCQAELRERFGLQEATFAFPSGTKSCGFSGGELAVAAREAGLLCALTTERELVLPTSDPFDWGRFTAESCDTAATLAGKLSGWYGALRAVPAATLNTLRQLPGRTTRT